MTTPKTKTRIRRQNGALPTLGAIATAGILTALFLGSSSCAGLERSLNAPKDIVQETPASNWVISGSQWVLASIHNHSVWNFEWMYDSPEEMNASELKDAQLFAQGLFDQIRNFEMAGYRELRRLAADDGIDVAVVTEHNTIIHDHLVKEEKFPDIFSPGPLLILNSTEWTSDAAHLGVFDYSYKDLHDGIRPRAYSGNTTEDIKKMTAQAKERGGFTIMNHPRFWIKDNSAQSPLGSDGVEILGNAPGMESASREFWHNMLVQGHRWFAVGSSDWHRGPYVNFPPFGLPAVYNLVRVDGKLTRDSFYAGLRNGRVQITKQANKGRLIEMQMETPNQLCRMGDECFLNGATGLVRIRISGGSGLDLVLITGQEEADQYFHKQPIHSQQLTLQLPMSAQSGFIRAELYDGSSLVQAGNPLYLR